MPCQQHNTECVCYLSADFVVIASKQKKRTKVAY